MDIKLIFLLPGFGCDEFTWWWCLRCFHCSKLYGMLRWV